MHRLACSILAAAFLSIMLTSSAALADGGVEHDRDGVLFGVGLGFGDISCEGQGCDDVTEAAGIDIRLGSLLSPRTAVGVDLWAMAHTEEAFTLTHTIATVGVQHWLLPRLWIKGGLGVAQGTWRYDGALISVQDETAYVPAAMAGAGYELVVGRSFALDLQLRGGVGFYRDDETRARNVALGVGLTWF